MLKLPPNNVQVNTFVTVWEARWNHETCTWFLPTISMCVQRETAYAYIRGHCTYMCTSYVADKATISTSLKQKCRRFDEIFITGGTKSCQNDNFRCSQWLNFIKMTTFPFQWYNLMSLLCTPYTLGCFLFEWRVIHLQECCSGVYSDEHLNDKEWDHGLLPHIFIMRPCIEINQQGIIWCARHIVIRGHFQILFRHVLNEVMQFYSNVNEVCFLGPNWQ